MNKAPVTKQKIASAEWEQLKSDAEMAGKILNGEEFKFLRDYFKRAKDYILEVYAKDSINDVTIAQKIDDTSSKTYIIPAKKEYTHLAGEYKFIDRLLNDLLIISNLPNQAKEDMKRGSLEIEESRE